MKAAMGWLFLIVVVAGGAGAGLYNFYRTSQQQAYRLELQKLKRTFTREANGLAHLEPTDYRREVGILLTRYFSEIGKLAKTYPNEYDPERERAYGEGRFEKGQIPAPHLLARKERIDLVMSLMERMRAGQYRPLYTHADRGFRFDIYDIAATDVSGEQRVKLSYVHWGAFGPVDYKTITGNIRTEKVDGKPAEVPQIVGEGQPPSLQVDPERWVAEFIPGVEVGYYDLPLFPEQATGVELSFEFGVRTVGGTEVPVSIRFPEIAVVGSWKVDEGQKWQAYERLATDEELRAAGAQPAPGTTVR